MQKTIVAGTDKFGSTNKAQAQIAAMTKVREAMQGNIAALDTYRLRQGQVMTAEDAWNKKILEGKATFGDMIKNRRMFNSVLQQQIALQKSVGLGWSQSTKTGKFSVDMFIPKNLTSDLNTAINRIGLLSHVTNVASKNLIDMGKNVQWAGRQLMVGFTVPVGIAAGAMGKMAYDLDKQITQVVKVYGDASSSITENINDIRDAALDTAKSAARVYGQSAENTLGIMADLAASGKSGMELQQATMATTRAAILGELDWQDAVKATISMQSVYGASQTELADNWNYINAMENQTVLSAQDFVTAIPKVSGVMNELGATLKDTGSLLTAFKAAGIDAAEGANALKSINFRLVATYGKGLQTFQQKTGKDLRDLIDETNGETIPSLMKFADAIKNLSAPDKIAVTRDVFGIYQGSKSLMLIQQMINKTDQWQQALDVANNTNIQNAAIAQQELDRQSEQPFKKLDKAVQSIKITLAEMGQAFLEPAAMIIDFVDRLLKGFNDLNPVIKKFAAGFTIAVAVAGPIVMLTGLIMNLAGTMGATLSKIVTLSTGWKHLTEEQVLQQMVSKKSIAIWDSEATAANRLTLAVKEVTAALVEARGVQASTKVPLLPTQDKKAIKADAAAIYKSNPVTPLVMPFTDAQKNDKGQYIGTRGQIVPNRIAHEQNQTAIADHRALVAARKADALAMAQQNAAAKELAAAKEVEAQATRDAAAATAAAEARMLRLTRAIGGAALGAGILTSMVGPQEGLAGGLLTATNALATFAMFAPGAFVKVGRAMKSIAGPTLGNAAKGVFNGVKSTAVSMIGYLKVAGPIIAAVGAAAFILINKWNDEIDRTRQKTQDFLNFAKNSADVLGYSYTDAAGVDPSTIKDGQRAAEVIAEKMRSDPKTAAQTEVMSGFTEANGHKSGERWAVALQAGIDAKLHGATEEQAKDTVRAALQVMGDSFKDEDFNAEISGRIDFTNVTEMMNTQITNWKNSFQIAINESTANTWESLWNGGSQISQNGAERLTKMGSDIWTQITALPKGERRDFLENFAKEYDQFIEEAWQNAQKNSKVDFKKIGINNSHDFAGSIQSGRLSAMDIGMGNDMAGFQNLKKRANGIKEVTQKIAEQAGVSKDAIPYMTKLFDLLNDGQINSYLDEPKSAAEKAAGATAQYDFELNRLLQSGQKVTSEKVKQIQTDLRIADGTYKLGNALQYFTDVSNGAAVDAETFNKKLEEMGFQAGITFDTITAGWKNVMSGAQDRIFDLASRQFEALQQRQMDSLQAKGQAALDKLDRDSDALDKKQKKAADDLDARLDKEKKANDDAWDARKKREAAVYDARIKKVEDAIKAEQEAEALRQKIFEAEQTRIQRLAQMYSTNIDINAAINGGNMDEAAKLSSNADAQLADWALSDASGDSASASDKRIENLNKQKDSIEKAKDAHMEALSKIEDAEKEAFAKKQERQKQELKDAQDAAKKKLDIEKKRIQDENAANEKQLRDDQARSKRELEDRLAVLRAFQPKNEAELKKQQDDIAAIYDDYGLVLKGKGNEWSKSIATSMKTEMDKQKNATKSDISWSSVGTDIAKMMINGAFGMSPDAFAAWINGGVAPPNSLFGTKTPPRKHIRVNNDPENRHSGGVIGSGGGARTGYSGEYKQSEVMVNALKGEGMVSRRGMRYIGKTGLDYINGGGKGGGGLGVGNGFGATVMGSMGRVLIEQSLLSAYNKRMGNDMKGQIGSKINAKPDAPDWLNNAVGDLGATVAYKSGRVIYLGHGAYPGGGNFSGNVRPAAGTATSPFGPRTLLGMSFHNGLDIANALGTPIKAAQGGRVIFTGWDNTGYGNYTEIQSSDGTMYGYGHQSRIDVRAGQNVPTGAQIGLMGSTGKSTGSHLHFQIGRNGVWFNPRTVMPQLDTGGFIQNDGLAKLHKEEVVVTKPLTKKFEQGVDNFAEGGNSTYNVNLNFDGAVFNKDIDVEDAVTTALRKMDRKSGGNRRIGGNR